MQQELKVQIEKLKAAGATYIDARWYPLEETNQLVMWNGNLKSANAARESGLGIRVLYKGAWGFSASSDVSNIQGIFDKAFDNARVAAERVSFPIRLAEKDAIQASFKSPNRIDPFEVSLADKIAFLQAMDEKLMQPGVFQRVSDVTFVRKQIIFIDSEGSEIEKNIIEVFPSIQVIGRDSNGEAHSRAFSPGRTGPRAVGKHSICLFLRKMPNGLSKS
jgi:TldD protein